jgi:hypothetical protein
MVSEKVLREGARAHFMLFTVSLMRSPARHANCLAAQRGFWIGVVASVELSKTPRASLITMKGLERTQIEDLMDEELAALTGGCGYCGAPPPPFHVPCSPAPVVGVNLGLGISFGAELGVGLIWSAEATSPLGSTVRLSSESADPQPFESGRGSGPRLGCGLGPPPPSVGGGRTHRIRGHGVDPSRSEPSGDPRMGGIFRASEISR